MVNADSLEQLYAFEFHLSSDLPVAPFQPYSVAEEYIRMGVDTDKWGVSDINASYELCKTYPKQLIVPINADDIVLRKSALYRSHNRLPVLSYFHKINKAVIVRTSQPMEGVLYSKADQHLLALCCDSSYNEMFVDDPNDPEFQAGNGPMSEANQLEAEYTGMNLSYSNAGATFMNVAGSALRAAMGHVSSSRTTSPTVVRTSIRRDKAKYIIVDVRSERIIKRGQGRSESEEKYNGAQLVYLDNDGLKTYRESFDRVRECKGYIIYQSVTSDPDLSMSSWLSKLDSSGWMRHIQTAVKSAAYLSEKVDGEGLSCVVHGQGGWDCTTLVISLAQLLLDPFYRTMKGFMWLIQKEWLSFGHKFSKRFGHYKDSTDGARGKESDQRAPTFILFLDCVMQIKHQFPRSFEFSQSLLIVLANHSHASPFGTFLCDSDYERTLHAINRRTVCLWSWLTGTSYRYIDPLYRPMNKRISPSWAPQIFRFWREFYCRWTVEIPSDLLGQAENIGKGEINDTKSSLEMYQSLQTSQIASLVEKRDLLRMKVETLRQKANQKALALLTMEKEHDDEVRGLVARQNDLDGILPLIGRRPPIIPCPPQDIIEQCNDWLNEKSKRKNKQGNRFREVAGKEKVVGFHPREKDESTLATTLPYHQSKGLESIKVSSDSPIPVYHPTNHKIKRASKNSVRANKKEEEGDKSGRYKYTEEKTVLENVTSVDMIGAKNVPITPIIEGEQTVKSDVSKCTCDSPLCICSL